MNIESNSIVNGNALDVLPNMTSDFVDFIYFSPPYKFSQRLNGLTANLEELGKECYRVIKPGGVCVLHICDTRQDLSQSLCTARTQVQWVDKIGWKQYLHAIWQRHGRPSKHHRTVTFRQDHENILIFFKGGRPKYISKQHMFIPAKMAGKKTRGVWRNRVGELVKNDYEGLIQADKCPGTIWHYPACNVEKDKLKRKHQCASPNGLVEDLIRCFTKPGDLVLDPMLGSGTTAAMACRWSRNYIGIDIDKDYCELANQMVNRECRRLQALRKRIEVDKLIKLDTHRDWKVTISGVW